MSQYKLEERWAFYKKPDEKGYDGVELAKNVFDKQRRIESDMNGVFVDRLAYYAIYTDTKPVMYQNDYGSTFLQQGSYNKYCGLSLNVVMSCIDSLGSIVAQNKPRIRYITDQGNDRMKQKARGLTYFNDGVFHFNNVYNLSRSVWKQSAVYGDGCAKVYWCNDEKMVKIEHQSINDVFIDSLDGLYGKPWEAFTRKSVSKTALIAMYPDLKEKIMTAQKIAPTGFISSALYSTASESNECVKVVECWRRPSKKGKNDGRHVISISNVVLLDEPWSCSIPLKFFKYDRSLEGFWGTGLTEKLRSIQLELNQYMAVISDALLIGAVPKRLIHNTTTVSNEYFNNTPMAEVKWSGRMKPEVEVPGVLIPGEFYSFLWQIYDKGFQIAGISQMTAGAIKPPGLETGAAQREYKQTQNERFMSMQTDFEDWFIELADIACEIACQNYTKASTVKLFAGSVVDEVKWGDITLNDQEFVIKKYSTALLPKTPAGMIQYITEKAQNGSLTRSTLEELLDMPDIGNEIRLQTAPIRAVMNQIYQIIDEGIYEAPDPQMNIDLARSYANKEYNDQLSKPQDDRDEKAMEMLLEYIEDCDNIKMKANGIQQLLAGASQPANQVGTPGVGGAQSVQARPLS